MPTTTTSDPRFLVPFVTGAWEDLLNLVRQHPGIADYRETQVHFELARFITNRLQTGGLRHWIDYQLFVDTPEARHGLGCDWEVIGATRPDITLRLTPVTTTPVLPVVIEIKILDTRKESGDDEFGPSAPRYSNVTNQTEAWTFDYKRLTAFVGDTNRVKAVGFMCTIHRIAHGSTPRMAAQFKSLPVQWKNDSIKTGSRELRWALQEIDPGPPISV